MEESEFKQLISGLSKLKSVVKYICCKSLVMKMCTKYKDTIGNIKEDLERIKYVCTTADIWSCLGRSFIDMTVHWIDTNFNVSRKL